MNVYDSDIACPITQLSLAPENLCRWLTKYLTLCTTLVLNHLPLSANQHATRLTQHVLSSLQRRVVAVFVELWQSAVSTRYIPRSDFAGGSDCEAAFD